VLSLKHTYSRKLGRAGILLNVAILEQHREILYRKFLAGAVDCCRNSSAVVGPRAVHCAIDALGDEGGRTTSAASRHYGNRKHE